MHWRLADRIPAGGCPTTSCRLIVDSQAADDRPAPDRRPGRRRARSGATPSRPPTLGIVCVRHVLRRHRGRGRRGRRPSSPTAATIAELAAERSIDTDGRRPTAARVQGDDGAPCIVDAAGGPERSARTSSLPLADAEPGDTVGPVQSASSAGTCIEVRPYDEVTDAADALVQQYGRASSCSGVPQRHRRQRRPAVRALGPALGSRRRALTWTPRRPRRHRRRARARRPRARHRRDARRDRAHPAPLPAHGPPPERRPRARRGDVRRPVRVGRPLRRRLRGDRRGARRRGRRARRGALRRARLAARARALGARAASPTTGCAATCCRRMSFLDLAWARLGIDPVESACGWSTGTSSPLAAAGDDGRRAGRPHPRRLGAVRHQAGRRGGDGRRGGRDPAAPRHARRADHPHDVERARPRRRARPPDVRLRARSSACRSAPGTSASTSSPARCASSARGTASRPTPRSCRTSSRRRSRSSTRSRRSTPTTRPPTRR